MKCCYNIRSRKRRLIENDYKYIPLIEENCHLIKKLKDKCLKDKCLKRDLIRSEIDATSKQDRIEDLEAILKYCKHVSTCDHTICDFKQIIDDLNYHINNISILSHQYNELLNYSRQNDNKINQLKDHIKWLQETINNLTNELNHNNNLLFTELNTIDEIDESV